MTHNHFDEEYYVMNIDNFLDLDDDDPGPNHPILGWGETDDSIAWKGKPIDISTLRIALKLAAEDLTYPDKPYEMADFMTLCGGFVGSESLKNILERLNIYGVQFIPVEITDDEDIVIGGYYYIHFWNRLRAIDRVNSEYEEIIFENILGLKKFSLDSELLNDIPLEKRLMFLLDENPYTAGIIVHKSIREAIQAEGLTGVGFVRVDEWDGSEIWDNHKEYELPPTMLEE